MSRHRTLGAAVALVAFACVAHAQSTSDAKFEWDAHPSIAIGEVRLDVVARAESDLRLATPAVGRDNTDVQWPGPRIELRGRATRRIEFEVSREFGTDAAWKDVFLNVRLARAAEISAGRFKIPFGRETLIGRANLDFIRRSLGASQLAPSRDTGLMLHGRLDARRFRYQVGYFRRDGDNARTDQARGARRTAAMRIVFEPISGDRDSARGRLQVGAAVAQSHVDNRLGLRGQSLLNDGVFFDRVFVNGRRRRVGLEALWTAGPVSVAAEYMRVADERVGMGYRNDDLDPVHARAWYVAGTWTMTGERKDGRIEPRRAITAGGAGAVELVARIEELHFSAIAHPGAAFNFPDPATFGANRDRALTLGVNWSLTRHLRVQHNYTMEWIADRNRSPAPTTGGRFGTAVVRLQLTV